MSSDCAPIPHLLGGHKCSHGAVSPRELGGTLACRLTAEGLGQTYTCSAPNIRRIHRKRLVMDFVDVLQDSHFWLLLRMLKCKLLVKITS